MIYVLISLIIFWGLLLITNISAAELLRDITDLFKPKKKSLKSLINTLAGKKKHNLIVKAFIEAKEILELTGRTQKYSLICRLSLIFALIGAFLSMLIGNILVIPILAAGFALLPVWYVKLSVGTYKKHVNSELETALTSITTAYIRCEDIKKAVSENVGQLRQPVLQVFRRFLAEVSFIDANVTSSILHMKEGINNIIFHEWCDTLIECQHDRTLAPALITSVDKFSDLRSVQAEFETELYAPLKEFITMALLTLANVPLMYFINKDWFEVLINHFAGQTVLAITAGVIFVALARVISITKFIEWRG